MQGLDHADLGARRAAGNDERQHRQLVDFVVAQAVELGRGHDHGVSHVAGHALHLRGKDADLDGYGLGGLGVVTSQHVHRDTGLVALMHGDGGLGPRWIVQTDQAAEHEIRLDRGAVHLVALYRLSGGVGLAGHSKHAQAHAGEGGHVLENLLPEFLGNLNQLVRVLRGVLGAGLNHALDGSLGVDKVSI